MTAHIEAARALYARTLTEQFALGAFNMDNQETLIAIARAAATKQAPVLVEVSSDEVQMLGLHNVRGLVDNYRQEYGIEMYLNLDHAPSVEAAQAGIDAVRVHSYRLQPGQAQRYRGGDHRGDEGGGGVCQADGGARGE